MAGRRQRWTSFVAPAPETARGRVVRQLHEEANPRHRLRVEHDADTLLVHLSDEDGPGWMTIAIDRATRAVAVARGMRQMESAVAACEALGTPSASRQALDRERGKKTMRRRQI